MITFREAHVDDAASLALHIGRETLASAATTGKTCEEIIRLSIERSWLSRICHVDGVPACAWGIIQTGGLIGSTGYPWLIPTPIVELHKRRVWVEGKRFVQFCLEHYPRLETYCHVEFEISRRWLQRLGFRLYEPTGTIPYCLAVLER